MAVIFERIHTDNSKIPFVYAALSTEKFFKIFQNINIA